MERASPFQGPVIHAAGTSLFIPVSLTYFICVAVGKSLNLAHLCSQRGEYPSSHPSVTYCNRSVV